MSYRSQPLRVEAHDQVMLITSKIVNSALWFVNNKALENHILGYLAKYQSKYSVEIFAFCIQGNHYHLVARFPQMNMAHFMRDFNARIAEGVRRLVRKFPGGPLFHRRYSGQMLPLAQDAENYFFYSALQAVNDGLAERISEYPGYNSVFDAAKGKVRKCNTVRYGEYNARKRHNLRVSIKEYTDTHLLVFSRLPGCEEMPPDEYAKKVLITLESKRLEKVAEWKKKGHTFPGKKALKKVVPGTIPQDTKQGTRRPIVLSCCKETKRKVLAWYFAIVELYHAASKRFRNGEMSVKFPPLTYLPPPGLCLLP